jgi:hypothetical protein
LIAQPAVNRVVLPKGKHRLKNKIIHVHRSFMNRLSARARSAGYAHCIRKARQAHFSQCRDIGVYLLSAHPEMANLSDIGVARKI